MIHDNIRLIALDLDGTTLTSHNTLSDAVKHSIEKAIACGIEVVAASGRPYASMPESVLEIEGLNYSITSNGAAIHDKSGKRIHSSLMSEAEVIKLLRLTEGQDLIFEAYINGLTYSDRRYFDNPTRYGCGEAYIDYARASHGQIDDMRSFIYSHRAELDGIEFICTDKAKRESVKELVARNTSEIYITSSSENFVEFMGKNATKGNAVKWICDSLKIDLQSTSACGNADNDVDMIKQSGLGAAVENATPLCLDCADIIIPSNDSDGIVNLIDIILKKSSVPTRNSVVYHRW